MNGEFGNIPVKDWLVETPKVKNFTSALIDACRGNEKLANLLNYFLYHGAREARIKKIDPTTVEYIEISRTLDAIIKGLSTHSKAASKKTVHDRIVDLTFDGLIYADGYKKTYRIYHKKIQEAINKPPQPDKPKLRGRHVARLASGASSPHNEDGSFESKVKSTIHTDKLQKEIVILREQMLDLTSRMLDLTSEKSNLTSRMLDLTSSLSREVACREALEAKFESLYITNTLLNTDINTTYITEVEKKLPDADKKEKEEVITSVKRKRTVKVTPPQQQTFELPEPLLTEVEQNFFEGIYCKASHIKAIPSLNATLAGHIKKIVAASVIHDVDDMDSYYGFVRSLKYLKDRQVFPGDLSGANNLNAWHEWKTKQDRKTSQSNAASQRPVKRIDETMLVWWCREEYLGSATDNGNWQRMERMPIWQARQCPKEWTPSYTHRFHTISDLYVLHEIPTEVWHPVVRAEAALYSEIGDSDLDVIYYRPSEVAHVA